MKKSGIATLLLASFVLTACSGIQAGSNNNQQSNVQDSTVPKDYKEELKKISDGAYSDARSKTDAISTYAENYATSIGSAVDNQDKKLNELLATILDKSYTDGSSTDMATHMFESYFLQSANTTDFKGGSDELALAETYHETVRSAIRLAEAKKMDDAKTVKKEKAELQTLKKALAQEAKKLGTVKGDKVYAQLAGQKKAADKPKATEAPTTTEKTTATSDATLSEKKEAAKTAEKVTVQQQTPVANPSSAANQPYHYVNGYVYVSTGKADKGLFLRSGPGQGYGKKLSSSLPNGTGLYLLGRQGDWYEVYVDGTSYDGWVHSSYVSSYYSAPEPEPVQSLPSYVTVQTNGDTLRLRSGAGKGYSEIAALQNGDVLEVLDQSGSWYQVYAPSVGKTGWVSKDFVY